MFSRLFLSKYRYKLGLMRPNIQRLSYGFVKRNELCIQIINILKLLVQMKSYLIRHFLSINTVIKIKNKIFAKCEVKFMFLYNVIYLNKSLGH